MLTSHLRSLTNIEDLGRLFGFLGYQPHFRPFEDSCDIVARWKAFRIVATVAEDSPVNQLIATETLENAGHYVEVVSNGVEAVKAVQTNSYDVVLMDIFMPELDGLDATRRIRELPGEVSKIPIIAVTADAMAGEREKYLAAGMDDYVPKPFEQNQLFGAFRHVVSHNTKST